MAINIFKSPPGKNPSYVTGCSGDENKLYYLVETFAEQYDRGKTSVYTLLSDSIEHNIIYGLCVRAHRNVFSKIQNRRIRLDSAPGQPTTEHTYACAHTCRHCIRARRARYWYIVCITFRYRYYNTRKTSLCNTKTQTVLTAFDPKHQNGSRD